MGFTALARLGLETRLPCHGNLLSRSSRELKRRRIPLPAQGKRMHSICD
jgi:hypothetical protein